MYCVSSGVCLCVGQCQHTSTWCSMETASFVCWLNAEMIIEVFHYEVMISCGSIYHNARNIIVAPNNTDFCHHFSEVLSNYCAYARICYVLQVNN